MREAHAMELPAIIESAKSRPLSYDPRAGEWIFYDDVRLGRKKIFPVAELTPEQQLNLAIERQLRNAPTTTAVLGPHTYTNEQVAEEMRNQTKLGKQLLEADLNYLKFYLSSFPREAFDDGN
jgi:hypothetical protein